MIYLLFFIKNKSILPSDTGNYKRKVVPIRFFGYLFGYRYIHIFCNFPCDNQLMEGGVSVSLLGVRS